MKKFTEWMKKQKQGAATFLRKHLLAERNPKHGPKRKKKDDPAREP